MSGTKVRALSTCALCSILLVLGHNAASIRPVVLLSADKCLFCYLNMAELTIISRSIIIICKFLRSIPISLAIK